MGILPANAAHWHTILVHLPGFALLFSLAVLLIAAAMKEGRFQRVALLFIVLTGASIFLVADTGRDAEGIVEHMSGIEETYIHNHEEAADIGVWVVAGLGVLALIILLVTVKQKTLSGKVVALMLVLTLFSVGWLSYVAKLGGQIHHPETRPGFVVKGEHERI